METKFLKEALFSGMTSNAFKLGTVLSLGWFWERVAGCHTVYCGQDGNIDYDSIQKVMELGDSQVTVPDQGLPANTIWHYIRRQVSSCGLESQDSPACIVIIDSNGDIIGNAPNPPLNLTIERLSNGRFRLRWRYTKLSEEVTPTGFNIYMDSGSGFNFSSPDATIVYGIGGINNEFSWTSGALTHGQLYRFCVRSYKTESSEWVSPTSHNDPDNKWVSEVDAYDDDMESAALTDVFDYYLELLTSSILTDKVRIFANVTKYMGEVHYDPDIDIDVYYDGGWQNIWSGVITKDIWVTKDLPSAKDTNKARIKFNALEGNSGVVYEFDFYSRTIIESQNTDYVAADADSEGPAAVTDLQASYEEI